MSRFLEKLVSVDYAIEKAIASFKLKLDVVETSVWSASGLVLAEDIFALHDQPLFHRSAVDGYAVRSIDTIGASPLNPVRLKVTGVVKPGDKPGKYSVGHGEAIEIYTGAPLPEGANAVIMYEDTSRIDDYVEIYKSIAHYENVSKKGEDYRVGELLLKHNTVLKPWDLAIIASNGFNCVRVYEKLRIGIICSGDEIVEPGEEIISAETYNSTCVLIKNYLDQISFVETRYYGVISDDPDLIRDYLLNAVEENHIVILSGGAGVSNIDIARDIAGLLGKYVFRGIALRPGRPTSLVNINDKPVFLLSGYPVAAWAALEAVVKPLIYKWVGVTEPSKPVVKARVKRRIPNVIGYRSYIRVKLFRENNEFYVEPYMLRGSGVLSSLVRSNAYIVLMEDTEGYQEGDIVEAILL